MKKTLYTLCVNDYEPEITKMTFPFMERYARKIGAHFHVIDERKFPDHPIPYEKFQIFELGKKHGNDWNIFFDADTLIHPDFYDVTTILQKDITCSHGTDFSPHRFRPNEYFMRDGRFIGKGNWCAIASDWCLDYWHPFEGNWKNICDNIFPTIAEAKFGITKEHLVDDYITSLNIARYGLKHVLITDLEFKGICQGMLAHQYLMLPEQKIIYFEKVLSEWGL